MYKKIIALLASAAMAFSFASCSDKASESTSDESSSIAETSSPDEKNENDTSASGEETTPEPTTVHVSPVETVSSTLGSQVTVEKMLQRTDGANTCKIPLSDLIEDGDSVSSFTFTIYSGDGSNIGTFKGGCGISVSSDCSAATDDGWYQSADFSASTEGTYGEIKWDVPAEVRDYIACGGEIMFGYWWGGAKSIRLENVVCTYTRTKSIPVDNQVHKDMNKSVDYNADENKIRIPVSELLEDDGTPQAITFDISADGAFGKFTGAFGVNSAVGYYQTADVSVFTESSSLSLTWILSDEAKSYITQDGDIMLGYWWSEQPTVTLNSMTVKYSYGNTPSDAVAEKPSKSEVSETEKTTENKDNGKTDKNNASSDKFRSASEIVNAINVGWNLGNTLDCYDFSDWTTDGETAWGNPKTTKAMIEAVKSAGFNSIRIPVTWGDHMNGNTIDQAWMNRVQEVVDYAYDEGMFVILNMHHDDYTWFNPVESEYAADSAKLCAIWKQISERFKNYGDRMIFEGMNEPRSVGSANEWNGGTAAERAFINKYLNDFVDTVRASGGNNARRALIITSYAASAVEAAVNDVVIPKDDNLIISIHYYAPWKFSDGQSKEFTNSDKAELDATFGRLKTQFADKNVPVIIGEFGCVAAASDSVRSDYYEYYISAAKKNGIKCFIWDNNVSSGESSFGVFSREKLSWNTAILNGIMNGTK